MNVSQLARGAAASLVLAIGATAGANAGSLGTRHSGSIVPMRLAPSSVRPMASNLNQVVNEGGTLASLLFGNLMDQFGSPIVVTQSPLVYRDGPAPTLPEIGIPSQPKSIYQYDYAAVGTGAAQLDFVAQQSGFKGSTTATYPASNDGEESYSSASPFGFLPWVSTHVEKLNPRTASDSLHWAAGDAPIPVGPVVAGFGTGTYADSLASYNGSIANPGSPSAYNTARGPAQVVPVFGTAVSVVFNASGLSVPSGGLKLTMNDVCGIFSGQITNWNQTSADPGSQAINIVHRSDGSGTTFLFTYDLSEICSKNNPDFATYGITNLWNAAGFTTGVGTDSENYTPSHTIPADTSAPAVVWPTAAIAEKGTSGIVDCINGTDDSGTGQPCGAGAVGYISPSFVPNLTQGGEAQVQNLAGNFEPANNTTTDSALAGASTAASGPPGYPIAPRLYFPFPKASNAAPISGYTYGYFYTCSDTALNVQTAAIKAFFNYAESSSATSTVAYWQLSPMKSTIQRSTLTAIDGTFSGKGPHSGRYTDPLSGKLLPYTCNPV